MTHLNNIGEFLGTLDALAICMNTQQNDFEKDEVTKIIDLNDSSNKIDSLYEQLDYLQRIKASIDLLKNLGYKITKPE